MFRRIVYLIQKAVVIVLVAEAKMDEPVKEEPPVDPVSDSQKVPLPLDG